MADDDLEQLQRSFLKTATWYFSEKDSFQGFKTTVLRIEERLGALDTKFGTLNDSLKSAGEAADHLSTALNRLTLWGVIVAAAGVILAAVGLWHDW